MWTIVMIAILTILMGQGMLAWFRYTEKQEKQKKQQY